MDTVMIILRFLHIVGGVIWAGGVFMLAAIIEPAVAATGAEGGKVMQRMAGPGKLLAYMTISAVVSLLAGAVMYWRDSSGFSGPWTTRPIGIVLALGALAALIGFFIGYLVSGKAAARLGELGREIQAAGGPPKPEQLAEVKAVGERLTTSTRVTAALLVLTVAAMATARYF